MKFLFDANLSPSLVKMFASDYEGSQHVFHCGAIAQDDLAIWRFASQHGFTIVSKDSDFQNLSFVFGAPPKVIWLRLGDASTRDIASLIRESPGLIEEFNEDTESGFLILGRAIVPKS